MSKKKKPQGQQPKWDKWTQAFEKVLWKEHPVGLAIVHTDEDLVELVNEYLDEEDRICYRTFLRYKAGDHIEGDVIPVFVSCYKKALRLQRENLLESLGTDVPGGWQRWAWIMERKFDEWNLRDKKVDETPDVRRLVFVVKED